MLVGSNAFLYRRSIHHLYNRPKNYEEQFSNWDHSAVNISREIFLQYNNQNQPGRNMDSASPWFCNALFSAPHVYRRILIRRPFSIRSASTNYGNEINFQIILHRLVNVNRIVASRALEHRNEHIERKGVTWSHVRAKSGRNWDGILNRRQRNRTSAMSSEDAPFHEHSQWRIIRIIRLEKGRWHIKSWNSTQILNESTSGLHINLDCLV